MKKLFLLALLPFTVFGQEFIGELKIALTNQSAPWDITFELTAVGARWDDDYDLTEDHGSVLDYISYPDDDVYFDHILDPSTRNDTFAVGLYKISAIENETEQAYFYMDWRTSDWSASLDVGFKYDQGNKRFRNWGNTQTIDYSYQTLWDLTSNELETDGLEDYWDNCLALTIDADNHPRIVWGPYPSEIGIFEYRIYRKHGSGSWELYDTVDDEVNIYTDTTVYINPPGGQNGTEVYYYVKGAYTERETTVETDPTNTIEVDVQGDEIEKKSESGYKQIHSFEFGLDQNYPNPFNPSTVISWQSPVDDFVTLKVFDVLGREVATLVDEYREAGNHTVEFNASNLSSGIYLYTIQIGNYLETRKLSLQK